MKLRLTFPKSHSIDEVRPLYKRFKSEECEVFSRWKKFVEDREWWDESQELREISDVGMEFIRKNSDWESNAAVISAWGDFGNLLAEDLLKDLERR